MKYSKMLTSAALVSVIAITPILSVPAMAMAAPAAAEQSGSPTTAGIPAQEAGSYYIKQLDEASDMMSQINLARQSLNLGMQDDAVYHLGKAQDLASQLQSKSPELAVASTLRFNGKVYNFNNKYKDYLIKVVDNAFTVADYDIKVKHNPKKDKVAEDEAGVGRYELALDIRNVQSALEKAKDFASRNEIGKAGTALNEVYQGAVEKSSVYEDPIWAIHDNLVAANTLLRDKDYKSAGFALKKAESELKTVQTYDKYAVSKDTLKRLEKESADLQAAIRKNDATAIQKAESAVSGWLKEVRDIAAQHAAMPKGK